jgi:Flp pilus assembly protein TadG
MSRREKGATVVEFALVLLLFLMFTLSVMDAARLLFVWNGATESTRAGARYAVVCVDPGGTDGKLLERMRDLLPQVSAYSLSWDPAGCTAANCQGVTVTITDLSFSWLAPIPSSIKPALIIPASAFKTYLPREILRQDPHSNEICN